MGYRSEANTHKVTLISRRILWSGIIICVVAGLAGGAVFVLGLRWKLMEIIAVVLFGLAAVMLAISWIMPGIFIIMGIPWFARAWFRGINPILIPDKPWDGLSGGEKFGVYFQSIVLFSFTLAIIIGSVLQSLRK